MLCVVENSLEHQNQLMLVFQPSEKDKHDSIIIYPIAYLNVDVVYNSHMQ